MSGREERSVSVELSATVVSGRGMASALRAEDVAKLSQKLGTPVLDGSLNLVCKSPLWLRADGAIYTGSTRHRYWHATLNGVPVLLDRWECPAHVFEVFSATHLRSELKLQDGDVVELSIPRESVDFVEGARRGKRLVWWLSWRGREGWFYSRDGYLEFLRILRGWSRR